MSRPVAAKIVKTKNPSQVKSLDPTVIERTGEIIALGPYVPNRNLATQTSLDAAKKVKWQRSRFNSIQQKE